MFKKYLTMLPLVVFTLMISKSSTAQSVDIQSVTISAGASTCTSDTATVNILLGCINFTYDSIAADVSNDTLNIHVYYTGGSICYGALSYPSFSVEIPATSYGTHTVIAKSYKSFSLEDTYTTTTSFASCEPVSAFTMSDSAICLGDSLWMINNSQSSNQYAWMVDGQFLTNDSNASVLIGSSGSSTVTLIVTDGNIIDTSSQTIIVLNAPPAINIGADTSACPGDSITLDAGAGYTGYAWSTGDSTQTILRSNGLYMVTVMEDGSCDAHDTIFINQIFVPDLVAIQTSASACDELEIGTSNSFANYSWSTGSNDSSIVVQVSGTYSVTASSAEGCEKMDDVTVTVLESPINNLGNDTTMCKEESWFLSLSAASTGTYLWQDSSVSSNFTVVNSPGVYWLLITADNGCTSLDSIVIDEENCSVGLASTQAGEVSFYPNPASTNLHVFGLFGLGTVTIWDMAGRRVGDEQRINTDGLIDVNSLPEGVYTVTIEMDGVQHAERVVILR